MSKKIILSLIILVPFFLSSCGYKRLYESDEKKIYIKNIEVAGDTRIGYSLKNDILLSSSPNASNILNIELNIDRSKTVKDKNKSGKIILELSDEDLKGDFIYTSKVRSKEGHYASLSDVVDIVSRFGFSAVLISVLHAST